MKKFVKLHQNVVCKSSFSNQGDGNDPVHRDTIELEIRKKLCTSTTLT